MVRPLDKRLLPSSEFLIVKKFKWLKYSTDSVILLYEHQWAYNFIFLEKKKLYFKYDEILDTLVGA